MMLSWNSSQWTNGPLTQDGIHLAGELGRGRMGVSVSRTTPLEENASGIIMVLTFRVKEQAAGGNTEVVFADLHILDSAADPLSAEVPDPVIFDIKTGISDLRLVTDADIIIDEGDPFFADAVILAPGVDGNRILCQVGINRDGSDPASWQEEVWSDMVLESDDGSGNLFYIAEVAFMRAAGEWFLALRSSLDGGDYIYGGPDGIQDGSDLQLARLSIVPRPAFRYSLAEWNFDYESLFPSIAAQDNRESVFECSGANFTGFLAGYSGLAVNSNGWSNTNDGPCYWWIDISTRGYVSLELSSRQYGSNTGPRDFIVEYSLDGFEWNAIDGSQITVGNNWTSGRLERLPLPAVLENRDRVLLRWIIASDISVNGAITGPTGTNRIDDIVISGINPDPLFISVYPGDANNDGVVNVDDVLPLGMYWLCSGPSAVWENMDFVPRNIEQWIPAGATFADTNGDGTVDHRDLMAVGLHFGKTTGLVNKDNAEPLATLVIDPLQGERIKKVMVGAVSDAALRGIAFSCAETSIRLSFRFLSGNRTIFFFFRISDKGA
jgi:hypothetical protein